MEMLVQEAREFLGKYMHYPHAVEVLQSLEKVGGRVDDMVAFFDPSVYGVYVIAERKLTNSDPDKLEVNWYNDHPGRRTVQFTHSMSYRRCDCDAIQSNADVVKDAERTLKSLMSLHKLGKENNHG